MSGIRYTLILAKRLRSNASERVIETEVDNYHKISFENAQNVLGSQTLLFPSSTRWQHWTA